jgi:CRISPR-associated protein Csx10
MLQGYTGITDALKLEVAYSSYDYRSGWNAAWGLPKDVELVTKMGGVFLFRLAAKPSQNFYSALSKLEEQGMGNRTSEGFGQVRICDEFHQIFREQPV